MAITIIIRFSCKEKSIHLRRESFSILFNCGTDHNTVLLNTQIANIIAFYETREGTEVTGRTETWRPLGWNDTQWVSAKQSLFYAKEIETQTERKEAFSGRCSYLGHAQWCSNSVLPWSTHPVQLDVVRGNVLEIEIGWKVKLSTRLKPDSLYDSLIISLFRVMDEIMAFTEYRRSGQETV